MTENWVTTNKFIKYKLRRTERAVCFHILASYEGLNFQNTSDLYRFSDVNTQVHVSQIYFQVNTIKYPILLKMQQFIGTLIPVWFLTDFQFCEHIFVEDVKTATYVKKECSLHQSSI